MPMKRTIIEAPAHRQAFEEYFWMRPRSIRTLAKKLGKTRRSVEVWSETFEWARRIEDRVNELHQRIRETNDQEYIDARTRQLKIAQAVQVRFAVRLDGKKKTLKDNNATLYEPTASDAVKWASQEMLLLGAATSRTEIGLTRGAISTLLATIMAAIRRVIPALCPHCKTHLGLPEKVASALREASKHLAQNPESDKTPVED